MKKNDEKIQRAIAIASIIIRAGKYTSSQHIMEQYRNLCENHSSLDRKSLENAIAFLNQTLATKPPSFVSRNQKMYHFAPRLPESWNHIQTLATLYLEAEKAKPLFSPDDYENANDMLFHLVVLNCAKKLCRMVEFICKDRRQTYKMYVHALFLQDKQLYLHAYDPTSERNEQFAFTDLQNIHLFSKDNSHDAIENSKSYTKKQYLRKALIKFSPSSKKLVQGEVFHKNQKMYEDQNGYVFIELPVHHNREAFSLVSHYMECAELVEPVEWREQYYNNLRKALLFHKSQY